MENGNTVPRVILDLLLARMKTEVLFAAVKLNIPDAVRDLEPLANVESLASKLNLPTCTLKRLLHACVALGLLEMKKDNDSKDVFQTSTEVQEWLLSSSEKSLATWINHESMLDHTFRSQIPRIVQDGDKQLKDVPNIFLELSGNPQLAQMFSEGMAGLGQTSTVLSKAFDLNQYKTAVDLAGGVGVFAEELKKTYPSMKVSVVELPVTIQQAESYWAKRGGQPDFNFQAGNMLEAGLPSADLYILSHVLHDHPDDTCKTILSNVFQALKPGGAVLLLEKILPDPPSPDKPEAHIVDMYMLCVPLLARERTAAEYRILLETAGFGNIQYKECLGNYFYDAIFAEKT